MKQSESVWFEEVDIALINYVSDLVKLKDKNGNEVSVPVKIKKEDEDMKVEEYPCITLYNLYSNRDNYRYIQESIIVDRDFENNKLTREKNAIPYNLFYQIDFWSRLQSDMNDMTRQWLGNHPDLGFNLDVIDKSGIKRSCNVMLSDDLKKADYLEGNNRTYRSMLTYKIWVEIDERISEEVDMITEIVYPETNKI